MTSAIASNSRSAISFSGHETFVCRHGWLKKALDEIGRDPAAFGSDEPMVTLGVGKNMVRSIRHWALATRIIEEIPGTRGLQLQPTLIGNFLFGPGGKDPYLEDPNSLWLLHWHLATNERRATTWTWAFHFLRTYEFTRESLLGVIQDELRRRDIVVPSENSLRRDIDCFIRTYAGVRNPKGGVREDSLECPLTELGLLEADVSGSMLSFRPGFHRSLGMAVFAFALVDFWDRSAPKRETMPFPDVAYGFLSPGMAFKIDENGLTERLELLEKFTNGQLVYTDTAGVRQVYRRGGPISTMELLLRSYEDTDPRGEVD